MIAQPVFVRTTFRRLLTAITVTGVMAVVPAAALSLRQMNAKNSSGSVPPLAATGDDAEQNVHFLTGVRFPPPALFFADPKRKWTLGDFENSDRPTNQYSVIDDSGDDGGPAQQYENPVQNPDNGDGVTITGQKPDEKPAQKPDEKPDEHQDGDHSQDILPTTAGLSEEVDGTTTTPVAEVGETETRRAVVAATVGIESPPTRDDQQSPDRQTVAHDRHKYPARLGLPPTQTFMLSVRPLPRLPVDVRFHDVNYYRSAAAVKRPRGPVTTTTTTTTDPRREH